MRRLSQWKLCQEGNGIGINHARHRTHGAVAGIKAEQALVAGNRELIARCKKKIQTTLARVWGEED